MSVYQCLRCYNIHGYNSKIPNLTPFPKECQRYLDCDVWSCPHCGTRLDSRDITPFLGLTGGGNLREITDITPFLKSNNITLPNNDTYLN